MTAKSFAELLLRGRRIGKDRYVARCPAHPDRTPSLSIWVGE